MTNDQEQQAPQWAGEWRCIFHDEMHDDFEYRYSGIPFDWQLDWSGNSREWENFKEWWFSLNSVQAQLTAANERAEAAEKDNAEHWRELAWLRQHCGLTASEREREIEAELTQLRLKAALADEMAGIIRGPPYVTAATLLGRMNAAGGWDRWLRDYDAALNTPAPATKDEAGYVPGTPQPGQALI